MEKAYKLEFTEEKSGSLFVNCCGCSKTEPLHTLWAGSKAPLPDPLCAERTGKIYHTGEGLLLGPGYGFLIPPEELVFYQADEADPWTYVWVGFSGMIAEDTVKMMGLSLNNPVFLSKRGEELYQAVKDMMEHNTYGIANDLRRNGQLQLFCRSLRKVFPLKRKARRTVRIIMCAELLNLSREITATRSR